MPIRIAKNNDKIKEIKQMFQNNKDENLIITDDITIIEMAYNNNKKFIDLFYSFEETYQPKTKEIINNVSKLAQNVYEFSNQTYAFLKQKENTQGVIAVIENKQCSLDDFKNKEFLFVLDHLEIPGNVGTIYRTLDAVGCDGCIMVDSITKIQNSKITSSSRGATMLIDTVSSTYEETQKWLLDNNYEIFLGEPNLGLDYQSYNYKGKIAIVVGNERYGINSNWYNNKNTKVYIPMNGSNNSLNVGVAASILAYEAMMKRNNK